MIWLEGSASFLVWIAYGFLQSRRSNVIREQVSRLGRAMRACLGASLFVVGAMVLIGGMAIILQKGGFTKNGMTAISWVSTTLLGLAFVHAQTMGMAMLVSLIQGNVTLPNDSASMNTAPGE